MASIFALFALLGVGLLALFPDPRLLPPDALLPEKATLLFLAVAFGVALLPALRRRFDDHRSAATFALLAAFFVLYHLADRAGPRGGFALKFSALPDDQFPVSYALRLAFLGAIVSIPAWWRDRGPHRPILMALLVIGVLGLGSFRFLSAYFPVGPTQTLDPTPLPTLFLQMLGYGSLAALCHAVTGSLTTRRLALRLMPLLLLMVWAKTQFFPAPVPAEDAE